jgi:hypothetical protein
MSSTIKLGDRIEEDCLDLLTDCLESYQRGKRFTSAKGGSGRPAAGDRARGDLLYEFVRMQAAQINHLARIGFAHADHGRRVLEAFYDAFAPAGECSSTADVEIKTTPGAKESRNLIIENRSWPDGTEIELRASCFRQQQDGTEFNHDVIFKPQKFELSSGAQAVITFTVVFDKKLFMAGRDYEMTINVLSAGCVVTRRLVVARFV